MHMFGGGPGLPGLTYLTPSLGGFLTLSFSLTKLQQLNITSVIIRVVAHVIPVICELQYGSQSWRRISFNQI